MIRLLHAALDWAWKLHRPDNVSDWVKLVAILIGGPWALVTFRRNNRIKAAELLLSLEDECVECLPTLLKFEYMADYATHYQPALAASVKTGPAQYTRVQSVAINEVEEVLRHFHACYHVRRLGVDAGALDRAYGYYLRMCISDERQDLRKYIRHFWPNIFFWAELAGRPWPKRLYTRMKQTWPRACVWWRGFNPMERANQMDFGKLSTSGLLMLYTAVRESLAVDDNIPTGRPATYGVRELPDWRQWADSLEGELDKRGTNYVKIAW